MTSHVLAQIMSVVCSAELSRREILAATLGIYKVKWELIHVTWPKSWARPWGVLILEQARDIVFKIPNVEL